MNEASTQEPRSSTTFFFSCMAASSAFTLARGFLVAAILSIGGFGLYATIVATGAFCGMALSFGAIEETRKHFPRNWQIGRLAETVFQSRRIERILATRALILTVTVSLASMALGAWFIVGIVASIGVWAMAVAFTTSGASFLRASKDLSHLGKATLTRAFLALLLAGLGAFYLGWPGAVLGEVAGAVVFAFAVERARRRALKLATDTPKKALPNDANKRRMEGRMLFFSTVMAAGPIYLDRLYVSGLLGVEAAGTYSFLMIFVLGAVTLSGVVAQRVGPEVVRLRTALSSSAEIMRVARRWILGMITVILVGMATVSALLLLGPFVSLAMKYNLTPSMFVIVTIFCLSYSFGPLDWVLLAHDRERFVLAGSSIYFIAASLALISAVWVGASITTILMAQAAAKACHAAAQLVLIRSTSR